MCRALLRWEVLRDEARLPLDGTLDLRNDDDLAPHFYLVRLAPAIASSPVEYCGSVLGDLCESDPHGRPAGHALPVGLCDRMVDFFHSAARYRQVLADSGSFISRRGDILYRNIVMPLQNVDGAVVSIAGAFSYRIET